MKRYTTLEFLFIFLFFSNQGNSADYYWVGGSGDWSEISHWATSSGGNVKYSVTPSAGDNVFFDENSFQVNGQIVTINGDIAFANNLIFKNISNSPIFRSSNTTLLTLFGSLELIPLMTFQFDGDILFSSSNTNNTINFANHNAATNVTFKGTGSWTLVSNLTISNTLNILEGTIDFGSNQISAAFFDSYSTSKRNVNFNNATILLTGLSVRNNAANKLDFLFNTYTIRINAAQWVSTSSNSKIIMSKPICNVLFNSTGTVNMPGLVATSPIGISYITRNTQNTKVVFKGDVDIKHDAHLDLSFDADNLIFYPGNSYSLLGGGLYTLKTIQSIGTCNAAVNINTIPAGQHAKITNIDPINFDFTSLKDLQALGAPAVANNATNLGNNLGITINEKSKKTFYWIGRTGMWSTPSNWSLTSGGMGQTCLPSLTDDVIFDNNSFNNNDQIVTLNSFTSSCKNMTWTSVRQGSTMTGPDTLRLIVGGSIEFSTVMKQTFKGEVLFVGEGSNTIKSNGQIFNTEVTFNNQNGTWTILDNFNVGTICSFESGNLIFNNVTAEFNRFTSNFSTNRRLDLNASTLVFVTKNAYSPNLLLKTDNLIVNSGTSHIKFLSGGYGNMQIGGKNDITFYNFTADQYNFNLYLNGQKNKNTFNHLRIFANSTINIEFTADSLTLKGGFKYILENDSEIKVNNFLTVNNCNNFINISGYVHLNRIPSITFNKAHTLSYLSLQNITAKGVVPIILNNSVDRTGNIGWQFSGNTTGRTLYWVGGQGNWNETIHWSLASGGVSGECIPTEIDNVIIDNRSMLSNNFIIYFSLSNISSGHALCKNFIYDVPNIVGNINIVDMSLYGDITIKQNITWSVSRLYLLSHQNTQNIDAPNTTFRSLFFQGKALVKLKSKLTVLFDLEINSGSFESESHDINIKNRLILGNYYPTNTPSIKFNKSKIKIEGPHILYNPTFIMNPYGILDGGESYVELTNIKTGIINESANFQLGTVTAPNTSGHAQISSANNMGIKKLILRTNGEFLNTSLNYNNSGKLTLDSLILSPGKSYSYHSGFTQDIQKHLFARGNNCNPISIFSSTNGSKAIINMPSNANIIADFIQMRDMLGEGGANFNAGPYSTNINNSNVNWIFPGIASISETVGFLGEDKIICPGETGVTIDANSYTPNEKYTWSNGATTSSISVQNSGNYAVTVTFGNTCTVIDTIKVTKGADITSLLMPDTTLCNLNSFTLQSSVQDNSAQYLWSTGATTKEIMVSNTNKYSLTLTKDGCAFKDSLVLTFDHVTPFNLGADINSCQGTNITLNVQGNYPIVRWQNGSTIPSQNITSSGIYFAEAGTNSCKVKDTITVTIFPIPTFHLGKDTTICQGENIVLSPGIVEGAVVWNDATTTPNYTVTLSGTYAANVTKNGCSFTDSIVVIVQPLPILNIGNDTTLCNNETLTLNAGAMGTTIWQNGSTLNTLTVNNQGIFSATKTIQGCSKSDSINVGYIQLSKPNLGKDTSICQGQTITLNAPNVSAQMLWNNGSTASSIVANSSGLYILKLTSGRCTTADSIDILVKPIPIINLGNDTTLCNNETIQLSAGSVGNTIWQNGSTQNTLTVSSQGMYYATKTIQGCSKSDTINISYIQLAKPNLGNDTSICQGQSVTLNAPSSNPQILWSTGSSANSIMANTSGTYILKLTSGRCITADTVDIVVKPLPNVNLGNDTTLCNNETLVLNTGSIGTTLWQNGSTQNTLTVNSQGMYSATKTIQGCSKSDTINVTYILLAKPNLGNDTSFCQGQSITLNAPSTTAQILWQNGSTNQNIVANTTGQYILKLTNGRCNVLDSINITVKQLPSLNLGVDRSLCENGLLTLDAGTNGSVIWQDNTNTQTYSVSQAGNYIATKTLSGCISRDTIKIDYITITAPNLGRDSSFCAGSSVTISTNNIVAQKYTWSDGSTSNSLSVNKSGLYWVESYINQCKKRDSIQISELPLPTFTSPKQYTFCENNSVSVTPAGDYNTFVWDNFPSNVIQVNSEGKYQYSITKARCVVKGEIDVTKVDILEIDLGDYHEACRGDVKELSVPNFMGTIKWSTGANTPNIKVLTDAIYSVTLSEKGCTKTDSTRVAFIYCDGKFLHFPNIFRPVSSGENNEFKPLLETRYTLTEYKLYVYDRFGNLMFLSESIDNAWDGSFDGKGILPGVYTYICVASADGPKKFDNSTFSGTVTVLR